MLLNDCYINIHISLLADDWTDAKLNQPFDNPLSPLGFSNLQRSISIHVRIRKIIVELISPRIISICLQNFCTD
jgi:hypothetical protein